MTSDSTYTRGEGERLTIHRCSDCGHDSLDPFDARCPECHSGSYQPIFVMRVSDHKAETAELRETAIAERSLRKQAERDATETWDRAERAEAVLREIADKGDRVETALDGNLSIVCVHPREVEEIAAIARAYFNPPRADRDGE